MKKSLLFLSMAMLAGNAFAANVLEAGTADSPKYYVIKANRGLPWVTYTAEAKDNGGAQTTIYRANELSDAAIWAVVPGTAEGTVNIFNYTTKDSGEKAYMFSFVTKDGKEFDGATGAVATTGAANDIFTLDNGNGSYGLALNNLNGYFNSGFYAFDATNNSEFLGNWYSCGDGGTQWWFYAVDTNNIAGSLEAAQNATYADAMKVMVSQYVTNFTTYATAVPWVASDLNEGIAALNNLQPSADYEAQISAIWNEYIGNANASLNTVFNGKQVAFENLRRKTNGKVRPYISVGETNYPMSDNYATDPNAIFTLESNGESAYYMYNAATSTYYGKDKAPVATKEEATTLSFMLNSNGGFTGVNIFANGVAGSNALNVDERGNALTYYSGNDGGSIWSVLEADDETLVEQITSSAISQLQSYAEKVPAMVANILNAGIDEIKALSVSADLAEKTQGIVNTTIATANSLLTTGMNGFSMNIYYPRHNRYLSYNAETADWVAETTNESVNAIFTIKTVEGGVVLYNPENNIYIGKAVVEGNQTNVLPATEESEAQVFTIELNNNSGFYGVSFVFTNEEGTERALNMNNNAKCLHNYDKADGGSIFVIEEKEEPIDNTPRTTTFDFTTDQYGYNVESDPSNNYLPADAEFTGEDGRCHITIDKASGSGVRFWETTSGSVELRVMKNSAITISVPKGNIAMIKFYGTNAAKLVCSNSDFDGINGNYIGVSGAYVFTSESDEAVESVTFSAPSSARVDLTKIEVQFTGGIEDTRKPIEIFTNAQESYTAELGSIFYAPYFYTMVPTAQISYSSSNTDVATIDETGSVTLVGVGTTKITASVAASDDYKANSASYVLNVIPEGLIYESPMGEDFTFEPDADIWKHDAQYGLKGSGYIADLNMSIQAEAIAVSPEITLPAGKDASLLFDQAINFLKGNPVAEYCNVVVRVLGDAPAEEEDEPYYYDADGEWVLIENAVTAPAEDSWNFYANAPVDLSAFAGKIIQIGFKYNSTMAVGCTWEIKNIMVLNIDPLKAEKEAAIAELTKYFDHIPGDHSWDILYYSQTIKECSTSEEIADILDAILNQLAAQYANNLEMNFFFAVGDKFGAYVKPASEGVNPWQVIDELAANAVFAGKRVNERGMMPWSATYADGETAQRESNNEDAMILYNVQTGLYLGQPTAAGEPIPAVDNEDEAGYWFVKPIDGQFAIADDANADIYLFWDTEKGLIASDVAATFPVDEIPVWDNGECDYYVSVIVPTDGTDEYARPIAEKISSFDVYVSVDAELSGIGGIECYTYDYRTDERVVVSYISAAQLAEITPVKGTGIYKKTVGWGPTGAIYEEIEFEANCYHFDVTNMIQGKDEAETETGITTPGDYYFETLEGTWIVTDPAEGKLFSPEVHEQVSILGEISTEGWSFESDPVDGAILEELSSIFICPESGFCTVNFNVANEAKVVFSSAETVIKEWDGEAMQLCALEKEDFWNDPDIFELTLDQTITANGVYTLYIPEGFFENEDGLNAETTITWTIEGNEVGISNITVNGNAATIFDLQGRRLNAASKGIFIINGKKVLVK